MTDMERAKAALGELGQVTEAVRAVALLMQAVREETLASVRPTKVRT